MLLLDDSLIRHIDKQKITDLILISNENNIDIDIPRSQYTKNVYAIILNLFVNLKHLSIVQSSVVYDYPSLSLYDLPPTTFSSLILTKLCINVNHFLDCLALLDGRLKNLTIFNVQINDIPHSISTSYNTVS